jgi:nitrogen fixation/metabolism regulation signal transduction histidine kinase
VHQELIAAVSGFDALPVSVGIGELDGTIVAVNRATSVLFARPVEDMIGKKAWEFAPGVEHIWHETVAAASATDYRGVIAIATPIGSRSVHYTMGIRSHAGRRYVVLVTVDLGTPP